MCQGTDLFQAYVNSKDIIPTVLIWHKAIIPAYADKIIIIATYNYAVDMMSSYMCFHSEKCP